MDSSLVHAPCPSRRERGQSYLFGCSLAAGKSQSFTLSQKSHDQHEFLLLHTASLGGSAPDEVHVLEISGTGFEKKQISVPVATLRQSVQPSIALHGLELHPPVKLNLLTGAGPLHVCGQHIVENEDDFEEEEEEDEDEEFDEEEDDEEEEMEPSDEIMVMKKGAALKQAEKEHKVESKPTGNTPKRQKLSQPQEQKAKPKGAGRGKK
uniref:nucleophosmin-like n=1 Tax=Myxine glutinosa TaxID=7769 RepID=UPI00358E2799